LRKNSYPPFTPTDHAKIVRCLSVHATDNTAFPALLNIIVNTTDCVCFFYAMDKIAHYLIPDKLVSTLTTCDREELKRMGNILFERSRYFIHDRKVKDWLGWVSAIIKEEHTQNWEQFRMDPSKSAGIFVSEDGCVCRHDFASGWSSVISNYGVTSGKWYFEAKLLTWGSFQIGWTTNQFVPNPETQA